MTKLAKILSTACIIVFFAVHALLICKIANAQTFEEKERLKEVGVWVSVTPLFICALSIGIYTIWSNRKMQ